MLRNLLLKSVCRYFSCSSSSSCGMAVTVDSITQKLKSKLDANYVNVVDHSDGCGGKFDCVIVSDKFKNMSVIEKHRLVHEILKDEIAQIHAFSQKSYTPEQWEMVKKAQA